MPSVDIDASQWQKLTQSREKADHGDNTAWDDDAGDSR